MFTKALTASLLIGAPNGFNVPMDHNPKLTNNLAEFKITVHICAALLIVLHSLFLANQLNQEYNDIFLREERSLSDLAAIVDVHIESTFRAIDGLLESTASEYEEHLSDSSDYVLNYMLARSSSTPEVKSAFISNESGEIIVATNKALFGVKISERNYFMELRAGDHSISTATVDFGQSKIDNKHIMFVARSLKAKDHQWPGLVAASIDLSIFHKLLSSFVNPDGESSKVLFLVNSLGLITSRAPDPEKYIWKSVDFPGSQYQTHKSSVNSNTCGVIVYATDNKERLSCARTVYNGIFLVFASKTTEEIFKNWRRDAIAAVATILVWLTVLMLLSRMLIRRQEKILGLAEQLEQISIVDALTGTYNRRHLDVTLSSEIKRAKRQGGVLSIAMVDIDYFKNYNDCYGHQAGDRCLRIVAETMQAQLKRTGDFVARYGGEEFCLIFPSTTALQAMVLMDKIRISVEALSIMHDASPFSHVTISCGISEWHLENNASAYQLISLADKALYISKKKGRNCISIDSADEIVPKGNLCVIEYSI